MLVANLGDDHVRTQAWGGVDTIEEHIFGRNGNLFQNSSTVDVKLRSGDPELWLMTSQLVVIGSC